MLLKLFKLMLGLGLSTYAEGFLLLFRILHPCALLSPSSSHNFSSLRIATSQSLDPFIIITMKLAITYFVLAVALMNASVYASASGLRLTSSHESDAAIATNDLSSDNNDGRIGLVRPGNSCPMASVSSSEVFPRNQSYYLLCNCSSHAILSYLLPLLLIQRLLSVLVHIWLSSSGGL